MAGFYVRINSDNERVAIINGRKGAYDKEIKNPHVRYGRNAIDNLRQYGTTKTKIDNCDSPDLSNLEKLPQKEFGEKLMELGAYLKKSHKGLSKFPPLAFIMQYMPKMKDGQIDKMALLGAAYQDLKGKTSISNEKFTANFAKNGNENLDCSVLDINEDGKIDVAEYSTSLLVSDILSKNEDNPDIVSIDGKITDKGFSALLPYFKPKNMKIARETFANLYHMFKLDKAQEEFLADKNNLVK